MGERGSLADLLFSRWVLLIGLSGLVATALVLGTDHYSAARRGSNLRLSVAVIPDSYLMLSKSLENRGYLVDRRDSTIRRSRAAFPGKRWNVERFGGAPESGVLDHWLLRSKRAGTVFFVPVEEVPDLIYPFYYGFVRSELEDYDLPWAGWTQLFVNRVYSGLYLRMDLPVDPRKKDGRSGLLRELLMVRGGRMTLVDTRFNPDGRLYAECVSNGVFPRLSDAPPAVLWLARRGRPNSPRTFLLDNAEPFEVAFLPLPASLADLFEKLHGSPLPSTADQRFGEWTASVASEQEVAPPFEGERRRRFERELEHYRRSLGAALRAHVVLHDTDVSPRMASLLAASG